MSDSLDHSAAPTDDDILDGLHARVVTDTDLDHRYANPLSNETKVKAICAATGLKVAEFDLTAEYPLKEWAGCDDEGLIIAGSFISDLQQQFYGLVINDKPAEAEHVVWEAHATAEYWVSEFERILHRRNGILQTKKRKFN